MGIIIGFPGDTSRLTKSKELPSRGYSVIGL